MKAKIYVFLKGKLMPLDNTLPFLVAIRRHCPELDIKIVSTDQSFADVVAGERLLSEVLRKYRIEINSPQDGERRVGKLTRLTRLAAEMLNQCICRPVFLINTWQIRRGRWFLSVVMAINRVLHGGKTIELKLLPSTEKVDRFLRDVLNSQYRRSMERPAIGPCDVAIASLPQSEFRTIQARQFVQVGYGRGFESWTKEVEASLDDLDPEIADDFIFWPLSVLGRTEKTEVIDLRETIAATIRLFMRAGITSQIVFRYHPTTDRVAFRRILAETGLANYLISNSHPHQLIRRCRFVFSNTGTSLYCDASFFRRPVVQYTPSAAIFCVRNEMGIPVASIYQPVVDLFFSEERKFEEFLADFRDGAGLLHRLPGKDLSGFEPTLESDERELIAKVFRIGYQRSG